MRDTAILCRYAHQDFFKVMRMSPIERSVLAHCIIDLYNAEVKVPDAPKED